MYFVQRAFVVGFLLIHCCADGDRTFMAYLDAGFDDQSLVASAMMPNVRESLDDCHMRYYKHSLQEEDFPMYDRPRMAFRDSPHLAVIGWTGSEGTIRWNCVGSLVWENFILTSARCTVNENLVAPDVARMADVELDGGADKKPVQQVKIVQVIRHPEFRDDERHDDIALLRLETKVELDSTVVPACLWNKDEAYFPKMDAVGLSGETPRRQSKVNVRPVPDVCNGTIMPQGPEMNSSLATNGLCVESSETNSCLNKLGGFLQVLLHHSGKMSPFIVAVGSSSDGSCDRSKPAMYTKVSPYVYWIRSTIEASGEPAWDWKFRPAECALRNVHLRHYEKGLSIGQTNSTEVLAPGGRLLTPKYTQAMVSIGYTGYYSLQQDCYGLIIDEDTVLTLARCTTKHGKRATYVTYLGNERNTIVKHYNHPGYREGQHQNDIGILKMKTRFMFYGKFVPQCIWQYHDLPEAEVETTGLGRRDLNYFSLHDNPVDVFEPQDTEVISKGKVLPLSNCSYPQEFAKGLPRGLANEHLCFGNAEYLVPETCGLAFGGPVGWSVPKFDRLYRYVYALNSFGRDCGFGQAAVAVRLSAHVDWIKTILLPDFRKDSGSLHFFNSDLEENDHCAHVDRSGGICTTASRCPKIRYEFSINRQVVFCSSPAFVCCPYENMVNETSAAGRELDDCETRYKSERMNTDARIFRAGPIEDDFPHLVEIGWKGNGDENTSWDCRGTIITRTAILTGAQCLLQHSASPSLVRLGTKDTDPNIEVATVIPHPEYTGVGGGNDVAVLKLKNSIEQQAGTKYPACIWTNQTHTPFEMAQLAINDTTDAYSYATAKYNADCAPLAEGLRSSQLCVDVDPFRKGETSVGDAMFWSKRRPDEPSIQYLVGIMSRVAEKDPTVNVYTRMSSFVGWIKSVL